MHSWHCELCALSSSAVPALSMSSPPDWGGLAQNADGSNYSEWQSAMLTFGAHQASLNVSSYLQVGLAGASLPAA